MQVHLSTWSSGRNAVFRLEKQMYPTVLLTSSATIMVWMKFCGHFFLLSQHLLTNICLLTGHVGKFMVWSVSGRTECYCKYDGVTQGTPCRSNTCYCTKTRIGPTVAPVEELNLPGPFMNVESNEYFLEGSNGCPCPADPKWDGIASTIKARCVCIHILLCSVILFCAAVFASGMRTRLQQQA